MFTGEEMYLWLLDRYLNIIGVEVKKLESKEKYIELWNVIDNWEDNEVWGILVFSYRYSLLEGRLN